MAHIRRLIQTRPNTDVSFFTPGTDVTNLISSYISSGKILENYTSTTSDDELTNTISIKFNTEQDWNEFQAETVAYESSKERYDYCSSSSISWSVENVEDNS
jgi:hypothetical protein